MTTSRSRCRFLAWDAALPPAASPPMTTSRFPILGTLGHYPPPRGPTAVGPDQQAGSTSAVTSPKPILAPRGRREVQPGALGRQRGIRDRPGHEAGPRPDHDQA